MRLRTWTCDDPGAVSPVMHRSDSDSNGPDYLIEDEAAHYLGLNKANLGLYTSRKPAAGVYDFPFPLAVHARGGNWYLLADYVFERRRLRESSPRERTVLPSIRSVHEAENANCWISLYSMKYYGPHSTEDVGYLYERDPHSTVVIPVSVAREMIFEHRRTNPGKELPVALVVSRIADGLGFYSNATVNTRLLRLCGLLTESEVSDMSRVELCEVVIDVIGGHDAASRRAGDIDQGRVKAVGRIVEAVGAAGDISEMATEVVDALR